MIVFDWKDGIKYDELRNNGLVVLLNETVYGLGANVFSNIVCKKIFEAKWRA